MPADVFRQDPTDRADAVIVVGAPDSDHLRHRISAGVALIKAGRAETLIVCGDGRQKNPEQRSEADRMREFAVQAGISIDRIVIEESSADPVSTAKECNRLLKSDSRLSAVRSIFLVSSAWHLLRLHIIMKRHLPNKVKLYCHPANEGLTASNWQTSPLGRATVENELRLIDKLLNTGYSLK